MDANEHNRGTGTGTDRVIEIPATGTTAYGLPDLRWFHGVEASPTDLFFWADGNTQIDNHPKLVHLFSDDPKRPYKWMEDGWGLYVNPDFDDRWDDRYYV